MIFQFFNKIAVTALFYSITTLMLCSSSMGYLAQEGLQNLSPWLHAATGLLGSYLILAMVKMALPMVGVFKLPIFFGMPTLCALLYWSHESKVIRIGVPALCMILFMLHPVGFYAAPYTLFWLIPMIITLFPNYNLLMAFGSTFTAHAVGSVMHLYVFNTLSAQAWIALMPLVIIERAILALSAWLGYMIAYKIYRSYKASCKGLYICK